MVCGSDCECGGRSKEGKPQIAQLARALGCLSQGPAWAASKACMIYDQGPDWNDSLCSSLLIKCLGGGEGYEESHSCLIPEAVSRDSKSSKLIKIK